MPIDTLGSTKAALPTREKTAMQQRKRTFQRLLWLLVGIIWLLGGCVAPDGSVIRFKQGPDGTVVGWQVDTPSEEAVTAPVVKRIITYPQRPLLIMVYGTGEDEDKAS